uniref:Centrosomal protein CEP164 n=1 Tax=Tetraselmis sp. GSL018 TaxID=582737 RepID=A0A061RLB9_9CHLO
MAGQSVILEEEIDENFEPSREEVLEYAKWLGMKLPQDEELLWIARDGLKAPLPEHWKPCKTPEGELYYFNFQNGESIWEHPCDEFFKDLFRDERQKLEERRRMRPAQGWAGASAAAQAPELGPPVRRGSLRARSGPRRRSPTPTSPSASLRKGARGRASSPWSAPPGASCRAGPAILACRWTTSPPFRARTGAPSTTRSSPSPTSRRSRGTRSGATRCWTASRRNTTHGNAAWSLRWRSRRPRRRRSSEHGSRKRSRASRRASVQSTRRPSNGSRAQTLPNFRSSRRPMPTCCRRWSSATARRLPECVSGTGRSCSASRRSTSLPRRRPYGSTASS